MDLLRCALTFSTCPCCHSSSGGGSLGTDVASLILLILMASGAIAGVVRTIDPFPFFISKFHFLNQSPVRAPVPSSTRPLHPDSIHPVTPHLPPRSTSARRALSPPSHLTSICLGGRRFQENIKGLLAEVAAAERDKLPMCYCRATSFKSMRSHAQIKDAEMNVGFGLGFIFPLVFLLRPGPFCSEGVRRDFWKSHSCRGRT